MLVHRLRRWPNIKPALDQCLALSGDAPSMSSCGIFCNITHPVQESVSVCEHSRVVWRSAAFVDVAEDPLEFPDSV